MKPIPLFLLALIGFQPGAGAQVFSKDQNLGFAFDGIFGSQLLWSLHTDVTIDAGAPSLAWQTSLGGPNFSAWEVDEQVTFFPPAFPFPPVKVTDLLTVIYTVEAIGGVIAVSVADPATPSFDVTLNGYTVPHSPMDVMLNVSVEYTLSEDGSLIQSGIGNYTLQGKFDPILAINTDGYPLSVTPVLSRIGFSPTDNTPLALLTAPSGLQFSVLPRGLGLVPEPWQSGSAAALGVLGFAVGRRALTPRRS